MQLIRLLVANWVAPNKFFKSGNPDQNYSKAVKLLLLAKNK